MPKFFGKPRLPSSACLPLPLPTESTFGLAAVPGTPAVYCTLEPVIVSGRVGRRLSRAAATSVVVSALAGFARHDVALPVRSDPPTVSRTTLVPAAAARNDPKYARDVISRLGSVLTIR